MRRLAGMCIPHKSQRGRGSFPSWTTATCDQNCWHMKCYCSRPALCYTAGHPSTGHITDCSILGKDTTYLVGSPPPSLTPLIWGTQMPFKRAMFCLRYDDATITPHLVQLTRILFLSLRRTVFAWWLGEKIFHECQTLTD